MATLKQLNNQLKKAREAVNAIDFDLNNDEFEAAMSVVRSLIEQIDAIDAPSNDTLTTFEMKNNESFIRGIYEEDGKFVAMTQEHSKTFKTRKDATAWLAKRGLKADETYAA